LLCYQILTKITPFADRPDKYKGREGLAQFVIEGARPEVPKEWPASLKNLVSSCWDEDPANRPKFKAIHQQWRDLTLDLLCPDTLGRRVAEILWPDLQNRPDYLKVRKTFLRECTHSRSISAKEDGLFRALLCEGDFSQVAFERFCLTIGWFGPLDKPTDCRMFFKHMKELNKKSCFHGSVAIYLSDHILKRFWDNRGRKKVARFHLILSRDRVGEFLIRKIDGEGEIQAIPIINKNGLLECEGKLFDSWKELLKSNAQWGKGITKTELLYANAF